VHGKENDSAVRS